MAGTRKTDITFDAFVALECRNLVLTQAADFVEQQMAEDAADPSHAFLRSEMAKDTPFGTWLALPTLQELRAQAEEARTERDRVGALLLRRLNGSAGNSKPGGRRGKRAPAAAPDDASNGGPERRQDLGQ